MAGLEVNPTDDAYIYRIANTYLEAQEADVASAKVDTGPVLRLGQQYYAGSFTVDRIGLVFDTSTIPDGVTIQSATLTLFFRNKVSGFDVDYDITLVDGSDLEDDIVVADFGDLLDEITALAPTLNTSGLTNNTAYDFVLNATGLALISKTGYTKLAVRSSRDISATAPLTDPDPYDEWIFLSSRNEGTESRRPLLTIVYVGAPTVTTNPATEVEEETAIGNGNIIDDGGEDCV